MMNSLKHGPSSTPMISSGKFPLLSSIVNNTDSIDSDELHLRIIDDIKSGKYESCLEALASYAQKNDNYEEFARLISPYLRAIIL